MAERVSTPTTKIKRVKILSMGDSMVGKSCLIKRYCEGKFIEEYVPTIGIDFGVKSFRTEIEEVKINFWDLGGEDIYLDIRNEFYKDTHGAFIVYDVNDRKTFQSIDVWLKECNEYSTGIPDLVLIANKIDLNNRAVSLEEGKRKAQSLNAEFYELSAQNGEGIAEMFEDLFIRALKRQFEEYSNYEMVRVTPLPPFVEIQVQAASSGGTENLQSQSNDVNSDEMEDRYQLNDEGSQRSSIVLREYYDNDQSEGNDISVNYSHRNEANSDVYVDV